MLRRSTGGGPAEASRPGHASHRRAALRVGLGTLGLLIAGTVWIIITGLLARGRLEHARSDLSRLRHAVATGDITGAERIGRHIRAETAGAHALTSGPAWWVAANVPVLGSPLETTRVIATAADRVGTRALPGALRVAGDLAAATRPGVGSVDLRRVAAAAPDLHTAAAATLVATRQLNSVGASWLPSVSSARTSLLTRLTALEDDLTYADRAIRIALPLLGQRRPQRIFIGFLNEAEARPLGGIPGQYAIATADHGQLRFERFGADDDLRGVRATVDLGADFAAQFAQDDPTGVLQNSTVTPDFRDAARIWAGMWQARTGERIDVAVAIDPTALGQLLDASGPARLPDGRTLGGRQVVALTEKDVYARFPDKNRRKAYLTVAARAAADRLLTAGRTNDLVRAAGRALRERRLMVYSSDRSVEATLVALKVAGAMPGRSAPVSGFFVTNTAGSKLDYYLDRAMTYRRTGCDRSGTALATLRLSNRAPATLPTYVTIRADDHGARARAGDSRMLITYYGSAGARIEAATVDGRPIPIIAGTLRGLPTVSIDLELPRGASRTVRLRVQEPAATGPLQVIRQPLVRPLRVDVRGAGC